MSAIVTLGNFLTETTFKNLSDVTREHVKMHVLDTVGAMLTGPKTLEGLNIGKLVSRFMAQGNIPIIGYPMKTTLLPAIIAECSAARCTEMDDYHLESLVTPGAVIIPTALSLVSSGYLRAPQEFLVAVAIGYEMLIGLGIAIDGPRVLYKGIWPTYMGAALGGAAVTAKALRLNSQQSASALATALALSTGTRISVPKGISSRCLTLGIAAQNGVIAAFSAQEGFVGDDGLLDKNFGQAHGITVAVDKLVGGLGGRFYIDQTGIKPFPVAGQALSAVEAFQQIVTTHRIAPESIQEISVWVPKPFVAMIDRPRLPENHIESVLSVQYQIALVAFIPNGLLDVTRDRLIKDDRISGLIKKIHVKPSEELEAVSSSALPARVEVQTDRQSYSLQLIHPKGDPDNRFSWEELIEKFRWVTRPVLEKEVADQVVKTVQNLETIGDLNHLVKILT